MTVYSAGWHGASSSLGSSGWTLGSRRWDWATANNAVN